MSLELGFYRLEESQTYLQQNSEIRYHPDYYKASNRNALIKSLKNYYNTPKDLVPMPFEIASLTDYDNHQAESQVVYDKQESSNILDDQEKTQVPSQTNYLEQIQEKQIYSSHILQKYGILLSTKHLELLYKMFDRITHILENLTQCQKIQQRFFSQHNSEQEMEQQQPRTQQFIYNPEALSNMLRRLRQDKKNSKTYDRQPHSLFRANQRLIQQSTYKLSLQHIPLIETQSPIIRSLQRKSHLKTCIKDKEQPLEKIIQKTEHQQYNLNQGALNLLKQLKKTKSTEFKSKKNQNGKKSQTQQHYK